MNKQFHGIHEKWNALEVMLSGFIITIIILVGVVVLRNVKLESDDFYNQCYCCEGYNFLNSTGQSCTDVFYDKELSKCVLVLCKNAGFLVNQSDCYYNPINKSDCKLEAKAGEFI